MKKLMIALLLSCSLNVLYGADGNYGQQDDFSEAEVVEALQQLTPEQQDALIELISQQELDDVTAQGGSGLPQFSDEGYSDGNTVISDDGSFVDNGSDTVADSSDVANMDDLNDMVSQDDQDDHAGMEVPQAMAAPMEMADQDESFLDKVIGLVTGIFQAIIDVIKGFFESIMNLFSDRKGDEYQSGDIQEPAVEVADAISPEDVQVDDMEQEVATQDTMMSAALEKTHRPTDLGHDAWLNHQPA